MRTIDAGTRAAYLSGYVKPTFEAVLRQTRLEFRDANGDPRPLVKSSYNIIDAGARVSDDAEGRVVWGDSCTIGSYKMRLINKAAWGDSANFLVSLTDDGADAADWEYVNPIDSTQPYSYCRVGVYPVSAGTTLVFYVWLYGGVPFRGLYRITLTYTIATGAWTWSGLSSRLDIGYPDAIAIHPVSLTTAIVVSYKDHKLTCKRYTYTGTWSAGTGYTVFSAVDGLDKYDVFFSDAEASGGIVIIVLNLASHGSAHAVRLRTATDIYSEPVPILGGGYDDSGYRIVCAGLSYINGRYWAVTYRGVEGSDGVPYASHTALASSTDGVHWRDEGFVGVQLCYGKLLYAAGDPYCYIAGNAVVYRAMVSYKLGVDTTDLKQALGEISEWRLSSPGAGSATSIESGLINQDSVLSNSDLLRAGNELVVSLGAVGQAAGVIATGYLAESERVEGVGSDVYTLRARGPLYRLTGNGSYAPPAGRWYRSPTAWYSDFDSEAGGPRQSLATVKGTWTTTRVPDQSLYVLKGEPADKEHSVAIAGLAIVPVAIHSTDLTAITHFKAGISVQGAFLVFWYQDEKNYWRCGIRNASGTRRFAVEQLKNGVLYSKTWVTCPAVVDQWYSLYLSLQHNRIRAYVVTGDTWDFSSPTYTLSYYLSSETDGLPLSYHIGLSVLDRPDHTDAVTYGTVSKSFAKQIHDDTKDFTSAVLGMWVSCHNQWRQVTDYTDNVDEEGDYISLDVDTAFAPAAQPGDSYGLYAQQGDPYVIFADLGWCEGLGAWTSDDIADDVLEMSGVDRTPSTLTLGDLANAVQMRDADITIVDTAPVLYVHLSSKSTPTGWKITIDNTYHYLWHENNGVSTLRRAQPNPITLSLANSNIIRVVVFRGNIFLYADGRFLGCFQNVSTTGRGYMAKGGTGTYTYREFGTMQESVFWGSDEEPNAILGRVLRGRHSKLVERADGTVKLSEFETRDDLGTWSTPLLTRGEVLEPVPSLLEVVGAEVRAAYINDRLAVRGLQYRRADSPIIEHEEGVLDEARRLMRLAEELAEGGSGSLYAPDPAAEIEDEVIVNGVARIVDSYDWHLARTAESISAGMSTRLRKKITPETPGIFGASTWGNFRYG